MTQTNTKQLAVPAEASVATALLSALKKQAEPLLALKTVDSDEAETWANDMAQAFKKAQATVKAERAHATKLRQLANEFDKPWKPLDDLCKRAMDHAKSLILARRRRAEAVSNALLESARKTGASAQELAAARDVVTPKPAGFVEKEDWDFEITDRSAIPDEYFLLDEARLRREARAMKAGLKVPGIKPVRKIVGALR